MFSLRQLSKASKKYILVNKRFMGSIKDAGGAFGAKASVEEEKFMHDHEKQVLKDYIKTHPQKQETKKAESAASTKIQPITPERNIKKMQKK